MEKEINMKLKDKELWLMERSLHMFKTFMPGLTKKEKNLAYNLIRKLRRKQFKLQEQLNKNTDR